MQQGGATPLWIAAQKGHTESITLLLQGGAAVDAKRQDGWTALFIAAAKGHTESITLLLQARAAVDAKKKVRGALLSLMSRALALLLSLSSLALFLGFISSIHAYVGSRL